MFFFKTNLEWRITKWSIETLEFDISLETIKALKAQLFTNFIVKITPTTSKPCTKWIIFIEGSANIRECGVSLILESDERLIVKASMRFNFSTTHNQIEYEAFITGLTMAL